MSIFKTFSDTIIIILNPQDAAQIQAAREREGKKTWTSRSCPTKLIWWIENTSKDVNAPYSKIIIVIIWPGDMNNYSYFEINYTTWPLF